ncbi:hypothetical protein GYMLUDRAFT_397979 [Collybiopsis luxurians FD-317 M1]|nr:hypothetical protein GYMLUDRAFT_397979 [Collybiopsis luxurians FD-317 M1]
MADDIFNFFGIHFTSTNPRSVSAMLKFLALFPLVLDATLVWSSAVSRNVAAPEAVGVLIACTNINLGDCFDWTSNILPTACISLATESQGDRVKSARTPDGLECTLFTGTACNGSSLVVDGTFEDLSLVGFSNVANSFNCISST